MTKKDIPPGHYCYTWVKHPTSENGGGKIKLCPFFKHKKVAGVNIVWCDYLNGGSVINNTSEEDYQKLLKHYGGEEQLNKNLPYFLLWDQVKECGENMV